MSVKITGLRLGGFRSLGSAQTIAPLKRFNFFVGANNSGKSTVLSFLHDHRRALQSQKAKRISLTPFEAHQGTSNQSLVLETGIAFEEFDSWLESEILQSFNNREVANTWKDSLLHGMPKGNLIWARQIAPGDGKFLAFSQEQYDRTDLEKRKNMWHNIWCHLRPGVSGGDLHSHWVPFVLEKVNSFFDIDISEVRMIPAVRQVGAREEAFEGFGGRGIIAKLAELQNPPVLEQQSKKKFEAINLLLQTVLDRQDAQLEIPHDREHVIVHMDGKSLPLASLGTGVEEVILIGAYCTIFDKCIWCIEEPEQHLHPILQRQLLNYLRDHTSSQYFIATHSAAFMDMPEGQVFHVTNDGKQTHIKSIDARKSRRVLTDELGYRASDIVQSNCVVWVEGPSDRLYLKNWLGQIDKKLLEGIDFSIMFYGGRLLSHLSGTDEIDDFINLKTLNQNTAILIDSDRPKKGARINSTKSRVRSELEATTGFVWVTAGREIENYIDPSRIASAVSTVHPKTFHALQSVGPYGNPLVYKSKKDKKLRTADKISVALQLCAEPLDLDILDLKKQVIALTQYIRSANGI